jgi:hypothetical protein
VRRLLAAAAVVMGLVLIPVSPALACSGFGCDVHTDDLNDAIEGSLFIPSTGYRGNPAARQAAADCPDCLWRMAPDCGQTQADPLVLCENASRGCPLGEVRMRVDRWQPGDWGFRPVASVCMGPRTPLTPAAAAPAVRDAFIELLPPPGPSFQPAAGGLVQVPTLFAAGQPGAIGPVALDLGPYPIELEAKATWTWDFGDGVEQRFTLPGGGWPDTSVSHTYRSRGGRQVTVTTAWTGTYRLDGLGPFPVTGPPVTQRAALTVPVREARSQLVAD